MKLRGNKTPVFSCNTAIGNAANCGVFLFCVRFWHFLVFSVEESKQKNSKRIEAGTHFRIFPLPRSGRVG